MKSAYNSFRHPLSRVARLTRMLGLGLFGRRLTLAYGPRTGILSTDAVCLMSLTLQAGVSQATACSAFSATSTGSFHADINTQRAMWLR